MSTPSNLRKAAVLIRRMNKKLFDQKVATVMHEFKAGKLKSSSGDKVTDRKQAIAIAISEARKRVLDWLKRKRKKS